MRLTMLRTVLAGAFVCGFGCSKDNDSQSTAPAEMDGTDASSPETDASPMMPDAGPPETDGGAQAAAPEIATPEDFESMAAKEITEENLEEQLRALESELGEASSDEEE